MSFNQNVNFLTGLYRTLKDIALIFAYIFVIVRTLRGIYWLHYPLMRFIRYINRSVRLNHYLKRVDIESVEDQDTLCSICFDTLTSRDDVIQLTCNHMFHNACIRRWIRSNGSCPQCREVARIWQN